MKKVIVQAAFVLLAVVLVSCNSDKGAVKKTSEEFLSALVAGDFAKSQALTTPETQAKWGDFLQQISDNMDQSAKDVISSSVITVSDVTIEGDKAEAVCSTAIPYFVQQTTVLHLSKVDGKWLINEPGAVVFDRVRVVEDVVGLDVNMSADSLAVGVDTVAAKVK